MNRLGAILVPMLAGFVVTVAVVSWRIGWWPRREVLDSRAVVPTSVDERRSNVRVVPVHLIAASPAAAAGASAVLGAPAAASAPAAAPEPEPEPIPESYEPPPVPRVDPGNSPERLEAPARKFAHGSRTDED